MAFFGKPQQQFLSPSEVRNKAINLLARREHSRAELFKKLSKFGDADTINTVLDELKENNLQSEERFVVAKIHSLDKKFSNSKIRSELKKSGVATELISANTANNPESEVQKIRVILNKKYKTPLPAKNSAEYVREKNRRLRFLQSRGFSFSNIAKAMAGAIDDDEFGEIDNNGV